MSDGFGTLSEYVNFTCDDCGVTFLNDLMVYEGWTVWVSRSRRTYCPNCHPKPDRKMLLAELADEVDRLQAALHLRDTTPKPPENAAWHWSLISNSDYTKVCAENALLRALTTVDDAMVERAALALCDSWGVLWESEPEGSREDLRRDARVVLEAALGVES